MRVTEAAIAWHVERALRQAKERRVCGDASRHQQFRKVRVTKIAVKRLISTPMKRLIAKPTMIVAPKLLPKMYRMAQVIIVEKFESRIEGHARLKPRSTADAIVRPAS